MSQSRSTVADAAIAAPVAEPELLQRLRSENAALQRYLAAQKAVITTLERRAGRSLESLGVHLGHLTESLPTLSDWYNQLNLVQGEVNSLSDLLADTMLLQKLEAGKVPVKLTPLDPNALLSSVSRHLLHPKDGSEVRLVCDIEPHLPSISADQELTEAVLTDLLGRAMRYGDPASPVVLGAEQTNDQVYLHVTAQRFAPAGNRDFATEIVLCCRRIEVQNGKITCARHPDGRETVTLAFSCMS